jgi:RNA polymerase-binding transcription factor DksA
MSTKKPARHKVATKAHKKPHKPVKKAAPKKAVAKKSVKPAVKKAVAKKSTTKKVTGHSVAKKSVGKVSKPVSKQEVKETLTKKHHPPIKSLVSVKPVIKPIVKKEPPKPVKVVIPKTTIKTIKKYEPEFTKSVLDSPQIEHLGPTQRYSDVDLAEFRELIQKKLEAAKKELAYLQGLITRKDETGDMEDARYMTMEDGSVSMEREQLSQMASRQIQFIDHLEKALMRIENKTYGICRVTGKLIDKARLRAVPHATLSIEAKQMLNK